MYLHIQNCKNFGPTSFVIQSISWCPQTNSNENTGWLAINNTSGITGVTCTSLNDNILKSCNLYTEHHKSRIVHIKWNDRTNMLTTCDEQGSICQWMPGKRNFVVGARYTLNYPQTSNGSLRIITDIAWSHNGKILIVCFTDGFLFISEEEEERRSYSYINPISDSFFTCLVFDPDDCHVLLGTTDGHVILVSIIGNEPITRDVLQFSEVSYIQCMAWSCPRFHTQETCMCQNKPSLLGIGMKNGTVLIQKHYNDQNGVEVLTGLNNILIQWSTKGELLAIAGQNTNHKIDISNDPMSKFPEEVSGVNVVIIADKEGCKLSVTTLSEENSLPKSMKITGIHWAHRDQCLFIAQGFQLHTARVIYNSMETRIATLQDICFSRVCTLIEQERYPSTIQLPPAIQAQLKFMLKSVLSNPLSSWGYKHQERFLFQSSKNILHCTLKKQNSMYILYMEFLGSLIPLMGAVRSKRKNEFLILDSGKVETSKYNSNHKNNLNPSFPQKTTKSHYFLRKLRGNGKTQYTSENRTATIQETELPLAVVTSNSWKTKFKIKKIVNSNEPTWIGEINYNPSVLHMAPRKINVELLVNNNEKTYCFVTRYAANNSKLSMLIDTTNSQVRVEYNPKIPVLEFCYDYEDTVNFPICDVTSIATPSQYFKETVLESTDTWTWMFHTNVMKRMAFGFNDDAQYQNSGNKRYSLHLQTFDVIHICTSNNTCQYTLIENVTDECEFYNNLISNTTNGLISLLKCSKLWDSSILKNSNNTYITSSFLKCLKGSYYERNLEKLTKCCVGKLETYFTNKIISLYWDVLQSQKEKTISCKLQNKPPLWNKDLCIYQLDCGGRVTVESEKNCQFEHCGQLSLQFGRIGTSLFTLDFCHPFSPIQAFAVALSSLTHGMK